MPSLPRIPLDPGLDERLVARCLAGDAAAWTALVRRYERLVYAVARGFRLDDDDLADVFQEVFAALVRGLPRLRDSRTLCRWLSSTTERIALATALRRRRERARTAGSPQAGDAVSGAPEPVGAELEAIEERLRVRLALDALGRACRNLLEALYYRDPAPGYREIAADLGIPVGSIGPTRARCLEKLERALAALDPEIPGIRNAPGPTSPAVGKDRRNVRSAGSTEPGGSSPPEGRPHVS